MGWNVMSILKNQNELFESFKEHLKVPSPIYDHSNIKDHTTAVDNFNITRREEQNLTRTMKESYT